MGSHVSHYGTRTVRNVENLVKRLEESEQASRIFVEGDRSDEDKLRDWDEASAFILPLPKPRLIFEFVHLRGRFGAWRVASGRTLGGCVARVTRGGK